MKPRIVATLVAMTAVAAYFGACNVPQPSAGCPVAHGPYVFTYSLKSGTGTCSQLKAEQVGMEKYNVPGTDNNTVAIQPEGLGNEIGTRDPINPADKPYAIAKLASLPNADGFCAMETATTSESFAQVLPDDGGTTPDLTARTVTYEWSNMKILANANIPGTVLSADLKYTENGCTAEYSAVGLWPPVKCATDDDCDPKPNLDAGRALGSGINPTLPVRCNMDTKYCELKQTPAELAAAQKK